MRRFALISSTLLLCVFGLAQAGNWPQWRGPTNDGISAEVGLPTEWTPTKNTLWSVPMPGVGGATPAVWGERIFVSSDDGGDMVLLCYNLQGKQLWKAKLGSGKGRYRADEGNDASPSPSTDGKHVFAFFGSGDFGCCDFDGKVIWQFNAQERYGKFNILHGMHVTPLLHGDRLYVSLLHGGAQQVVALEKATGKEAWKVERPTDGQFEGTHSYASPLLWRHGKEECLVVHGCDYTTAHRLSDGQEIWRLGDLNSGERYDRTFRIIASPTATADLLIVPTCKGGPIVALKPDAKGPIKAGSPFEQWRIAGGGRERPSKTPDVPCPLIHDGVLYLVRELGRRAVLICMDVKTGKEHYSEPLHADRYRASPVLADGKIYLIARDGMVTVVKPGTKFEKLASFKMEDQITATPAIANGRIYVRGFQNLYAIGMESK